MTSLIRSAAPEERPVAEDSWSANLNDTSPPTTASDWNADRHRCVDASSSPFTTEFPDTFTWTSKDEGSRVTCSDGPTTYLRGAELGVGGYARVYKTLRQTDNRLFAGKTSSVTRKLVDEAQVLRRHSHEHLLKYGGWYEDAGPETTMLLTELCAGGNLHEHINNTCQAMEPGSILRVVAQTASALQYLHEQGLYHSDVKPKNVFIRSFSPVNVVLGDCADIKPTTYRGELLGTPGYYPPEVVAAKKHCGSADDIWALGVTVLGMMDQWPKVMYTREVGSRKDKRRIDMYPKQCWEHVRDLEGLNQANGVVSLLGRMLGWTARERINAGELEEGAESLLWEWRNKRSLDLVVPDDFEQIQFW